MLCDVANSTAIAKELGFQHGDVVQEWMWDDDVDDSIRQSIQDETGEEIADEDWDGGPDGAIIWWRDGDDEDTLSDTIVDASTVLDDDAPFWILTPKPGREGAASSFTIRSAAKTAGMNIEQPLTISQNWIAIRLLRFGGHEN